MNREADPAVALLSYTAPATNLAMVREKMSLAENCRKLPYSPLFSSSRASLRASSSCGSAGWAPSSRVKTTTLHFRESWVNSHARVTYFRPLPGGLFVLRCLVQVRPDRRRRGRVQGQRARAGTAPGIRLLLRRLRIEAS